MRWLLLAIPLATGCCYDNCLLHGDWSIGLQHDGSGYDCQGCDQNGTNLAEDSWPMQSGAATGKFHPVPTRPVFEPPSYGPQSLGEEVPAEPPTVTVPRTSHMRVIPDRGRRRPTRGTYSQQTTKSAEAALAADNDFDAVVAAVPSKHSKSVIKDLAWVPASYAEPIDDEPNDEPNDQADFVAASNSATDRAAHNWTVPRAKSPAQSPATPSQATISKPSAANTNDTVTQVNADEDSAPAATGWRASQRASTLSEVESPAI